MAIMGPSGCGRSTLLNLLSREGFMLKNDLTVALRNLCRQRWYALLNVAGLSVGVALSALAILYIHHEWSYDRFHESAERIYLVRYDYRWPGSDEAPMVCTPPVLAPTLREEMPDLGAAVRVYWGGMNDGVPVVPAGGEPLEARGVFVDPGFFEMFSFPVRDGDALGALVDPGGVVLSAELAQRCFAQAEPIGQEFAVTMRGTRRSFEVRAVVDVPSRSSLTFDFAISHEVRGEVSAGWGVCHVLTFVELPAGVGRSRGEELLERIARRHMSAAMQQTWGGEEGITLRLLPLLDMHFTQGLRSIPGVLNPAYCWVVGGIALGLLAIACVNFVNLSLALMSRRIREVGIRKAVGASRRQLGRQFLVETAISTTVSVAAGIALAELALPFLGDAVGAHIASAPLPMAVAAAALAGLVALASGMYPAALLARLEPARILRGQLRFGGTSRITRALIVPQFACSTLFAVVAVVMSGQVEHLRAGGFGFDSEQVLVIDVDRGQPERSVVPYESLLWMLRQAAQERPEMLSVGAANNRFLAEDVEGTQMEINGDQYSVDIYYPDEGFFRTLGMELVEGRDVEWDSQADRQDAMVVNEALALALGAGNAVGRHLADPRATQHQRTIVGVVRDFHGRSPGQPANPSVFRPPDNARYLNHVFVRLAPGAVQEGLRLVEEVWAQIFPGRPLPYHFLDDDLANALGQEGRWIPVTRAAALVGLAIAELGLLGLTALAVERRTKEIGIRKAVGAPVGRIVVLLSREYTVLIALASAVAWPLAAIVCTRWLDQFATRIELSWVPFAEVGIASLLVAWAMMGVQILRVALANPMEALRYE